MKFKFSKEFRKQYQKLSHKQTRLQILKQLQKIETTPEQGKPLGGNLQGVRSLRIHPYRVLYRIEKNTVVVLSFDHRKRAYKQ